LKEQSNDIKDIKIFLETSITEISTNINGMRRQVDAIQNHASKSFEMLKELNYLDGIENIKSAHDVFFSRSKHGLERRIDQFESHVFELQKQYTQHMNPRKIGRFLNLLNEEEDGGQVSALSMYHYVLTVEAMYLQMMFIYNINNDDMESAMVHLETFATHCQELTTIMTSILQLDEQIPELRYGKYIYRNISSFGKLCLSEDSKPGEMAPFMKNKVIDKPIFLRQEENCLLYHVPLLWVACEAGENEKVLTLLRMGANINLTAFTPAGVPLSCLQVAAKGGHLELVQLLLQEGAQVNNGQSCLLAPCEEGQEDVVQALLQAGEDPNRPGEGGVVPLVLAKQEEHPGIVSLLEQYGADTQVAQILMGKGGRPASLRKEEEKPQPKLRATGPYGRAVSQTWSDGETAQQGGRITGVRMWTGIRVDSIQVRYGTTWAQRHGAEGGSLKEFELSPEDKITGVIIRAGSHIEAIGFSLANGKRIGPYGSGNAEILNQQNCELVFISGSADCQPCQGVNSITFHWTN